MVVGPEHSEEKPRIRVDGLSFEGSIVIDVDRLVVRQNADGEVLEQVRIDNAGWVGV